MDPLDRKAIIDSRRKSLSELEIPENRDCEGGCGVIGIVSTEPLAGKLIIKPCRQMRNRGNGKGGGVAAVGLFPEYREHYALHIAFLDETVRQQIEQEHVYKVFDVAGVEEQPTVSEYRDVGLTIKPPDVVRYFVRVKESCLDQYLDERGFVSRTAAEDEFVYQNSFQLNYNYYVKHQPPQAFVLSHGKNLMILKGVGFAEEVASYYCLEDVKAHVWIGHQRYPTRGRVWHPGGAHPFAGLHESLVHNGDFANYFAATEYLKQWGSTPLFVTDTEVSVLLFDLYSRVLGYPLEYVIEALGPTPEGDFERLPKRKQRIYQALQTAHMHGSPDGPWFFIIARADPETGNPQLIGITDVSMLRPQVFSLQIGEQSYGAIASERQAVDKFFSELALEKPEVPTIADHYWNARGGSCTDGGAFTYTVVAKDGGNELEVKDKFGKRLFEPKAGPKSTDALQVPQLSRRLTRQSMFAPRASQNDAPQPSRLDNFVKSLRESLQVNDKPRVQALINDALAVAHECGFRHTLAALTMLHDRRWEYGLARPGFVKSELGRAIDALLDSIPCEPGELDISRVDWESLQSRQLSRSQTSESTLVIDAQQFPPEGEQSVSRLVVAAYQLGWRNFILYRLSGDRFIGCGLGANSSAVRIELYGASGDYLGSGVDGATIIVHGSAQDQVGQVLKSGRLVIFGDVGQTFLYGAKGGEAFVMGNAAGRPLINAVGKVRAVINGTCLDYCAESFMAGSEIDGGFVIINGLSFDEQGAVLGLELKYPGNNLFSLASGGACYLNDPYITVSEKQLNGASFVPFSQADWSVIKPYLDDNENYFGISIRDDLLMTDGVLKWPKEVFRKVVASGETKGFDWSSLTT